MRALTVATKSDGYYPLLLSSADQFGYELTTLGSGEEWTGMAGKMIRYRDELSRYDPDTLVMLVDAYDVVFAAPAREAESLFKDMQLPYLLSGQRYFASSPFIRRLADEVMGLDRSGRVLPTLGEEAYGRPCMGALMGWAGSLVDLFTQLVALEDEHQTGNDQILINLFLEKHPDAAHIDRRCTIFQNLWRTRGRLPINGVFHPSDPEAEVRVLPSGRPENRFTGTRPQVIHGFMDLDMNPLLESLGYDTAGVKQVSGAEYFDYSIKTYLKLFLDRQVEAVRRLLRR